MGKATSPLRMEAKAASFAKLVKRYSGDMPARAMLDELLRAGAVKQLKDGRICLLSRGYVPQKGSAEKLTILGSDTADLITTIDHNLYEKPAKPRIQRKVMDDNVPVEPAREFQILSAAQSQELLEAPDRRLPPRASQSCLKGVSVESGSGLARITSRSDSIKILKARSLL